MIEDDSGVHAAGDAEGHAAREVALDQAGNDVRLGSLGSNDEVNAHGPTLLSEPAEMEFDVLAAGHHQVGQFVDDDHNVGQVRRDLEFLFFGLRGEALIDFFLAEPIESGDVADTGLGEQLIPLVHFLCGPL